MRNRLIAILAGCLIVPAGVLAEEPEAASGFTFKMVKPPTAGQKRITVQLHAENQAGVLTAYPNATARAEPTVLTPET